MQQTISCPDKSQVVKNNHLSNLKVDYVIYQSYKKALSKEMVKERDMYMKCGIPKKDAEDLVREHFRDDIDSLNKGTISAYSVVPGFDNVILIEK